jgi:predicted DNA-binding transcriptional regulator YafY
MQRLERLVSMALFFSSRRRVLAREVADTFGISLRTVYRDVKALAAGGFPIEGTAGDGYRVAQSAFLRPLSLTADEAEALTVATKAFSVSAPALLRDALASASIKLESTLEATSRKRVRELQAKIFVPDMIPRDAGPMPDVLAAIHAQTVARIAYVDLSGKSTKRSIEPLGLVCLGSAWWLVAYCRLRQDARAFRVDRISKWANVSERFELRPRLTFAEVIVRDKHLGKQLFGY